MIQATFLGLLFLFFHSVSGSEVEGYTKTAGAWILSVNRRLYSVKTTAECATKCDTETSFTCRQAHTFRSFYIRSLKVPEQHLGLTAVFSQVFHIY